MKITEVSLVWNKSMTKIHSFSSCILLNSIRSEHSGNMHCKHGFCFYLYKTNIISASYLHSLFIKGVKARNMFLSIIFEEVFLSKWIKFADQKIYNHCYNIKITLFHYFKMIYL
jgi:hypothetical protein